MKKAVSILLALALLVLTATSAVNAQIINRSGLKTTEEAIAAEEAASGNTVDTVRLYFKMPDMDTWYSDYGVYQGKYYAGIYWWDSVVSPAEYPGFRASIDNYEQGIYYAEVPDDVLFVIWNNGFAPLEAEYGTQKDKEAVSTVDLNVEGALPDDYESLPEGSPVDWNFDGCIFVIEPELTEPGMFGGKTHYSGNWYIYYGDGCYGNYAQTSENFISVDQNCVNPDHFDEQGNHIGGAHITAPVAPEDTPYTAPVNPELNGYYLIRDREPDVVRSENKLYDSFTEGEYFKSVSISASYRFRIVYYQDGVALSDCAWYPAEGWYNQNGELDDSRYGHSYTVYFRPDGGGDSTFYDKYIKVVPQDEPPTEAPWAAPTEAPTAAPTEAPTGQKQLYREQFEKLCADMNQHAEIWDYDERYYHYDENGEMDWVLVYGETDLRSPMFLYEEIANRVIMRSNFGSPFSTGFGIYDVKKGTFEGVGYSSRNYEDFDRVFDEYGGGRLVGDLDGDNAITIIDATVLQRCEAQIRDYPENDEIDPGYYEYYYGHTIKYFSDFDRDGERDIIDATCIQRYLADLPYPKGQ